MDMLMTASSLLKNNIYTDEKIYFNTIYMPFRL